MPSKRYFENDTTNLLQPDAHAELLASLNRINTFNPPVQTCSTGWTFRGLYAGPTSVAFLFLRLSQMYPDLLFKGQSLLDWATCYLSLGAVRRRADPVDSHHCGIANETLAHLAVSAVVDADTSLAQTLCSYAPAFNAAPDGSDEWLYGRAGYLYLLRLARSVCTGSAAARIDAALRDTAARILASPQPWTWHGKPYAGAAHGTLGVLTQLALSNPACASHLEGPLSLVLDAQYPASGNFPSSVPTAPSTEDKLVQFCHGAAGAVLALRTLRGLPQLSGLLRVRIDTAIAAAADDVWRRGLLLKAPCLCHGIAGNALALDDEARFTHFLGVMAEECLEQRGWMDAAGRSDDFVGLFTGEAGRAWAWACADLGGGRRDCIGFNDL